MSMKLEIASGSKPTSPTMEPSQAAGFERKGSDADFSADIDTTAVLRDTARARTGVPTKGATVVGTKAAIERCGLVGVSWGC